MVRKSLQYDWDVKKRALAARRSLHKEDKHVHQETLRKRLLTAITKGRITIGKGLVVDRLPWRGRVSRGLDKGEPERKPTWALAGEQGGYKRKLESTLSARKRKDIG